MYSTSYLPLILTAFLYLSCSKELPEQPVNEKPPVAKGIYVLNEGNFQKPNSSLTYHLPPDSSQTFQDIFGSFNNRQLGDTGNDIVLFNQRAYIVVSQSQKVEVISLETKMAVGTLQFAGNKNPCKLAIADDSRAYVTNLYEGTVTEFNPSTLQITRKAITVGSYPQGIIAVNGKVYVCNSGWGADSTLSVIDMTSGAVIKKIVVMRQPAEIQLNPEGNLIVRCEGTYDWSDPSKDTPGGLVLVDPIEDSVIARVTLAVQTYGHPGKISCSAKGDLYIKVMDGVIRISSSLSPVTLDYIVRSYSVYSITFDDTRGLLYVTDAGDYKSDGRVYVYDQFKTLKYSFNAGIIPSTIAIE